MCKLARHIFHAAVHFLLETEVERYWKVNLYGISKTNTVVGSNFPYFPFAVWYLQIWASCFSDWSTLPFWEDKFLEVGLDLIKDFGIAVPKALVISMKSGAKKGALGF